MKKTLSLILIMLLIFTVFGGCTKTQEAYSSSPNELACQSAIMYNFNSDSFVYEKQSGQAIRPGSLVQVMTAMVVMDNTLNIGEEVESTRYSFDGIAGENLPNADIYEGEIYTVNELLIAMLLGNNFDAANLLARHVSRENPENFVAMMNTKAAEIGMDSTTFVNPHGALADAQITTAADMLKMAKYFIENYTNLYDIANMSGYDIKARSGQNQISIRSKDLLTTSGLSSEYFDSRAKNIKYSTYDGMNESYEHLITYFEDELGMRYLIVVMRAPYLGMPAYTGTVRNPDADDDSGEIMLENPLTSQVSSMESSQMGASSEMVSAGGSSLDTSTSMSSENSSSETASNGGKSQGKDNKSSSDESSGQTSSQSFTPLDKTPYVFVDTKELIGWASDTFTLVLPPAEGDTLYQIPLTGGFKKQSISVGLAKKPKDFLPNGAKIDDVMYLCSSDPFIDKEMQKGDIVGVVKVLGVSGEDNKPLQDVNLVALEDSEDSTLGIAILRFLLLIIVFVVVAFIGMIIIRMRNLAKKKEKRRRRRERIRRAEMQNSNIRKIK